jgi:hypothetical protein
MLDVGSPRVLNCNVMTKKILAKDPVAQTFFRCKPLNNIVLIKDTDPEARLSSIGTKLYLPFNQNDIYEGGRTIFVHDTAAERGLIDTFGEGALPKELLAEDMRIMKTLDRLPSLDPFLLKDVFDTEGIVMNNDYFDVSQELWDQIELFILQGFEPLAKAAFPDAVSSDEMARKLIEKIWEGSDMDALKPLVMAFRLPPGKEKEIFAAWKGVIYYGFERQRATPLYKELHEWMGELKIPAAAATGQERDALKATIEQIKTGFQNEWQSVERVLNQYQVAYDKMFVSRSGSADFVTFLQNSSKAYQTLGNGLGRTGHATYCWNVMSKRFPNRKMPWEQTREFITLMSKIFIQPKAALGR